MAVCCSAARDCTTSTTLRTLRSRNLFPPFRFWLRHHQVILEPDLQTLESSRANLEAIAGGADASMVLYYTSTAVDPPATIYMGKDKFENEELLKYGLERDVWFHVDKLSSAHVYLRLPDHIESWEAIPEALVSECSQLVKTNSIEGNKKSNLTIIYTPWANVKKSGDMAVGAVTFHNDRKVKRYHVKEKDNAVVNRLNKTRREVQVDHEAERQDRLRQEGRVKKAKAIEDRQAQQAEQKKRKEEAEARDYSRLYTAEAMEEERRRKDQRKLNKDNGSIFADQDQEHDDGLDSDDSFM